MSATQNTEQHESQNTIRLQRESRGKKKRKKQAKKTRLVLEPLRALWQDEVDVRIGLERTRRLELQRLRGRPQRLLLRLTQRLRVETLRNLH